MAVRSREDCGEEMGSIKGLRVKAKGGLMGKI